MSDLHFPWLEISILIPLCGSAWVRRSSDPVLARKWCLLFSGLTLATTALAWQDFGLLHAREADDPGHLMRHLFGREVFVIDQLSAPLLPMMALLYFLTILATLRTKIRRFSFSWTMLSESLVLALFSCKTPWVVIGLLAAGTVPPLLELRARGKPTGAYLLHITTYVALLTIGEAFVEREGIGREHTMWAIVPLLVGVFIRSGVVPFHCWLTELYEHATFGTALLFTMPMTGAYAAVRLLLPIAPDSVLQSIGMVSLVTAVYASAMALVQREGRRFFCYVFISQSALVLVGLEIVTPMGLTGALCVWLSAALSLGGFGLTLRALEARRGTLSLHDFQGLYEHTPALAVCFFLTGLGTVGFPGTFGFVGSELLVDGAVEVYPHVGVAVVLASALIGIAFVKTYFTLFTGTVHRSTVSLAIGRRERFAVLVLAGLIIAGGLVPQFNVASREHAAREILAERAKVLAGSSSAHVDDVDANAAAENAVGRPSGGD